MTATEELRRLLDERGVKYDTHGERFGTWYDTPLGGHVYVPENNAGWLHVRSDAMTPEQAIAATLGRGECKPMTYDNGYSMDRVEPGEYYEFWEPACACSGCGELIPMRRFCPNCGAKIVDPTTNDVDGEVDA